MYILIHKLICLCYVIIDFRNFYIILKKGKKRRYLQESPHVHQLKCHLPKPKKNSQTLSHFL